MPGFKVGFESVEGIDAKTEFYYTYTWEVPLILGSTTKRNELIILRECTTPTFTVNKESYTGASLEYKFAKSVAWEDVKLTWYDTKGLIDRIRDWRRTVWTASEGLKTAKEYKKNSQISCFLPDSTGVFGWILRNSWPSSIRNGELTYTNSDIKVVEVTLSYDWADECSDKYLCNTPS